MSLPMMPASPCERHGCAACCYDTEMPLTEDDIARIVALGHARESFVLVGADGFATLRTTEPAEGMPGRPCALLRENRCSVYADRPAGCRIYPLVLNEQRRVVRDEDCPHRAEFPMDASAKRRIERIMATLRADAKRRA